MKGPKDQSFLGTICLSKVCLWFSFLAVVAGSFALPGRVTECSQAAHLWFWIGWAC